MRVLMNDDIPVSLWENFLIRNLHASPFQSPSFYRLFNSIKNFYAEAFAVSDDGILKALAVITIQKEKGLAGFFSRRGIIYGGPLADADSPQALDILLKKISESSGKEVIYVEVRNLSDYSSLKDVFLSNGFNYLPWLNFRVDTRDKGIMERSISNSRMRQIKKAQGQAIECREAKGADEVSIFYGLLKKLYRNKLHRPLPPEEFFLNFYHYGLGKYLFIWYEGKIIGGILCPVLEGRVMYEFYVCGQDEEYRELYPSVMATWSAIKYAAENNIPLFDFMGAGKPEERYGVRDFKARFGGELVEYGRFQKISKPFLYSIGKSGLKFMKFTG